MIANIGTRIKDKRAELNMTLAELGAKVGVGASTVRKWEVGHIKDMRSDKIQTVADALGVTPAYLMGWDKNQNLKIDNVQSNSGIIGQANAPVTISGDAAPLNKEETEIIRIYRELGVKGRIDLIQTAISLAEKEGI